MFDSYSIPTDDVEGCKKTMPPSPTIIVREKSKKQTIYKIITLLRLLGELRSQGNQMNEIPKTDKPLHRDTNRHDFGDTQEGRGGWHTIESG